MKRVFVFDLDDTLYDERTYVASGFRAVAAWLKQQYGLNAEACVRQMDAILDRNGRGQVFDLLLAQYGLQSRRIIEKCVQVYRSNMPELKLFPDASRCLERLRDQPLYIVTDGNKHVQQRKLQALGLYEGNDIRKCYITRRYGIRHEKPSPYCFLQICRKEQIEPTQAVYIGDNPSKDFVGIKPLGFHTVRILRGMHKNIQVSPEYEADWSIESLDQMDDHFIDEIFNHKQRGGRI